MSYSLSGLRGARLGRSFPATDALLLKTDVGQAHYTPGKSCHHDIVLPGPILAGMPALPLGVGIFSHQVSLISNQHFLSTCLPFLSKPLWKTNFMIITFIRLSTMVNAPYIQEEIHQQLSHLHRE